MTYSTLRPISKKQAAKNRRDDKIRQELRDEFGDYCMECGAPGVWPGLGLSHETPKGMGGTSHIYTKEECKLLCQKCHANLRHGENVV